MKSSEELKKIYEERYKIQKKSESDREINLYRKYRGLIIPEFIKDYSKLTMLDLGCGNGKKTFGFGEPMYEVIAVDLSETVIEQCKKDYTKKNLQFKALDALNIKERFDIITAFGFSLFNTNINDDFINNVEHFYKKNLNDKKGCVLIIGSFTDFSGTGSESWYMHSKSDLDYIKSRFEEINSCQVQIIFPGKKTGNYLGYGLYNLMAETYKAIFKKRKTFFIKIVHG